nr:tetratricopeptide repeat protein [Desulfobacula sp.]
MRRIKRVFFQMVLIFFIGYTLPDPAQSASPESDPPEPEKKFELIPPAENTDELFKAAAALAEKDPEAAVRLYRRALLSKPDAWEERGKMARLYEKLEQTDAAVTEFEAVNHAIGTAQSHRDLIRVLEKKGMLPSAAAIALQGAGKFPEEDALAVDAGKLLLKAGQVDRAAEFLERSVQKQNKNLLFLLGQALEQQGHPASALKAYLKSMDAGTTSEAHEKAFQRLAVYAVKAEELWVFPPRGWEKNGKTLSGPWKMSRSILMFIRKAI